jgi:hypothetical protein
MLLLTHSSGRIVPKVDLCFSSQANNREQRHGDSQCGVMIGCLHYAEEDCGSLCTRTSQLRSHDCPCDGVTSKIALRAQNYLTIVWHIPSFKSCVFCAPHGRSSRFSEEMQSQGIGPLQVNQAIPRILWRRGNIGRSPRGHTGCGR